MAIIRLSGNSERNILIYIVSSEINEMKEVDKQILKSAEELDYLQTSKDVQTGPN